MFKQPADDVDLLFPVSGKKKLNIRYPHRNRGNQQNTDRAKMESFHTILNVHK